MKYNHFINKIGKLHRLIKYIFIESKFPVCYTIKNLFYGKRRGFPISFMMNYNLLSDIKDFLSVEEYLNKCVKLNCLSLTEVLNNKTILFKRFPSYMRREYLDIKNSSEKDILSFVNKHKKVIGKCNWSTGKNIAIYDSDDENCLEIIKLNRNKILEELIVQHGEYAKINSSSVNTLRIHTIRTSKGCKIWLYPKLRVGMSGEIVDIGVNNKTSYRVLLNHDGYIIAGFEKGLDVKICDKHKDSGYMFDKDKKLPFVKEAEKLCLEAAARVPEVRFIGWDIAVTEEGPIIVEANAVSGAIETYQIINYLIYGKANKEEIETMLQAGMEGISFNDKNELRCVSFADLSYLETPGATPSKEQQFAVLLQSALHNYGIQFFSVKKNEANCEIVFSGDKRKLRIKKRENMYLPLPNEIPLDVYAADILARNLAKEVYANLINLE